MKKYEKFVFLKINFYICNMRIEKQNLFFTSDFHIGHQNAIKFDNRPFRNLNEMHETLINNWNSVVTDDDIVFYLGDLSYKCKPTTVKWFVEQLKGKIYFIMGNHDKYNQIKSLNRFENIYGDSSGLGGMTIQVLDEDANRGYQDIVMCHYAILSWNKCHHSSWHLHGHSHQSIVNNPDMKWFYERKVLDMGCNGWDYTPISYEQIKNIMNSKSLKGVDHHE
jgi:calcineurin-like phosphoesterase family protein